MAISNINAIINDDIHKVWDIVLAVDKYSVWRSDLSKTANSICSGLKKSIGTTMLKL